MALSAYGIDKSEKELARLTKATRTKGCLPLNMLGASRKLGLKGYIKHNSSIKELRHLVSKRIAVIVCWFSPEEAGHYSAACGFDKSNVYLADPHFGRIMKYNIKWFEERWFYVHNGKLLTKGIIAIYK